MPPVLIIGGERKAIRGEGRTSLMYIQAHSSISTNTDETDNCSNEQNTVTKKPVFLPGCRGNDSWCENDPTFFCYKHKSE